MLHCPYCGTSIKEDENYCIKCGKLLPEDRYNRITNKKWINRNWKFPLFITAGIILSSIILYVTLEINSAKAKELYNEGEEKVLDQEYKEAKELFQQAINHKANFQQAHFSLEFMDIAIEIRSSLEQATKLSEEGNYQEALSVINQSESKLNDFNGSAVNNLIETITQQRNAIKLQQVQQSLAKNPNIDKLKVLLWDVASIDSEKAEPITKNIRNQIIDYTSTKANEQLNNKQFTDAQLIVEDGLKYAPDSEKLLSLQTTIDKEKVAFETAQQKRIEQAMTSATKEKQVNETDAIEMLSIDITDDEQGNLVVKGEVQSVATIPINSIMIEYALLTENENELTTNEVYVYPDELYPEEKGKFEFTHFDIEHKGKNVQPKVKKITWYTD
ncbi:zinc-ribbon domain-containing protein [Virgibacillus salexigens]|uniref:zinc-ribbon domain-containing protein n=1 Tax=Virgibacillus salexigens TaxID=61016 RepID=UPI00190DD3CD|nr:zinc-ribbon domain-containing protein [Virgibacillus salexigens]